MGMAFHSSRTPATLEELEARVRVALARHPLCRKLDFDVMPSLRDHRGANWNVKLRARIGMCPDEALAIIRDIQDAYQLCQEPEDDMVLGPPRWMRQALVRRFAAVSH